MKAPSDMFAQRLLEWFDRNGRHDLPWQHPREPYRVWVSEIMLQQTQVRTAIPYFERFVAAFPTLPRLAAAPLDDVLAQWSGLGYYARARNLHAAAKRCVDLHDGGLPRDLAALVALPGVGRSTAAAILAQAWGERFPILDGNVKRVLARYHGIGGWPNQPAVEKQLWALAEQHLPAARMADYTQAQMDFGATLCTRQNPACALCVLQESCVARLEGRVEELPTPRPGKILPERSATVILAENGDGEVLLQRRPPIGIWASLWSLPEAADSGAARVWFDRHLHGDYAQAQPLKAVRHAFSHYRLQLHPLHCKDVAERALVRDNDDLRWVARPALVKLGLPAPIRKLLSFVRTEMTRTVFCEHTRQQAEGLDFVPYPGPLGQRIYAHIGKPGWAAWLSHQTMLINENRLSPRDPAHRAFLERELEKFLFEGSADRPAGYVPEG